MVLSRFVCWFLSRITNYVDEFHEIIDGFWIWDRTVQYISLKPKVFLTLRFKQFNVIHEWSLVSTVWSVLNK